MTLEIEQILSIGLISIIGLRVVVFWVKLILDFITLLGWDFVPCQVTRLYNHIIIVL